MIWSITIPNPIYFIAYLIILVVLTSVPEKNGLYPGWEWYQPTNFSFLPSLSLKFKVSYQYYICVYPILTETSDAYFLINKYKKHYYLRKYLI